MSFTHVTAASQLPDRLSGPTAYIDLETFGKDGGSALDVLTNIPRLISIADDVGIYVVDLLSVPLDAVLRLFEGRILCNHNIAFDLAVLMRLGFTPGAVRCTMIASQLLCNGLMPPRPQDLASCMERFCEMTIDKGGLGASDWSSAILSREQLEYSAQDVRVVRQLDATIRERIQRRGMQQVYDIECRMLPAVVQMRLNGVAVDVEEWTVRSKKAEVRAAELEKEVLAFLPMPPAKAECAVRVKKDGEPYKCDVAANIKVRQYNATRKWNLGSWQQVLAAFAGIGIKLPNTAYQTLAERHDEHPIFDKFMDWKDAAKEAGTFGMDWLKHVRPETGRVHPDWRQLWPVSGRMSCGNPNLQQVMRGAVRKGIVASPGRLLVRADFSQIEARVAARISGDETLIRLFVEDRDIHAYTAARVLGKDPKEITKADRQIGKSLVFGLLFGMQAKSLRIYCRTNYGVKMTLPEAMVFRDKFFEVFPGLAAWHLRVRRTCERITDVRSLLGRRRIVQEGEDVIDPETGLYRPMVNKLGVGLNHPVQGSAADLMKISVAEMWERRNEFSDAKLVMLVHDEIVLDTPEDQAAAVGKWLKSIMVECGNEILKPVPVDAEIKIGKSWGG